MKKQPLGICDFCLGPIPRRDWYTSKGAPRLHCSLECKQTANSRAGNPKRVEKLRLAIALDRWSNPAKLHPPDPEKIGLGVSRAQKRRVKNGTWRNPALDQAAREKLSRPRKHTGPLASATERLKHERMADLTEEEHEAHKVYRRELAAQKRAERTPEMIEQLRARWRAAWKRRNKK